MIDGGVIAGYLALAAARGVDRFVNGRIDSILAALANRVARKMGLGPAADLRPDPTDTQVQKKIARAVVSRSQSDPQFARDLRALQDQLDREGGRPLLQQFWNNSVNQAFVTNSLPPPASSGSPPPAKSRWYSASWWTGVGGVAALVATLIGFAAWWFPQSPDSSPPAAGGGSSVSSSSDGPLSVTVLKRGGEADCPLRFYLPQDIDAIKEAVPLPPDDYSDESYINTLEAWVESVGGWRATNSIEFSVEGNSVRATILTDIRINLVSRTSLMSKTLLSLGECGAPAPPRHFSVDFAATPPRVRALPGEDLDAEGNPVPVEAVNFPFTVSETDPEIFDLRVVEPGPVCDCQWTATLSYTRAGRSYVVTIADIDGKPFHAVPADHVPEYTLINGYLERVQK